MAFLLAPPIVTIGIPAYNAVPYLQPCLESIAAQTFNMNRVEVIVVDDGSSDDTLAMARRLLRKLRLRGTVLTQANTGTPARARNFALDRAKGKWLLFLDVDDYLGPHALAAMTDLGEIDDADVVVGKYVGVNRGVPKVIFKETLSRTDAKNTPLVDSLSVHKMYRTVFARGLEYRFNSALKMAEDHPFALAANARTDRVAVQADVDCYFLVRHQTDVGAKNHLTGHVLPVDDAYAYMFESFDVLRRTEDAGFPMARHLADRYWHRLLSFDIPLDMRRSRTPDDRDRAIAKVRRLLDLEDARRSEKAINAKSGAMLRALELGDRQMVESVARLL